MRLRLAPGQHLALFFTLAFAIGWLVFIPLVLRRTPTSALAFIGLFAPAIAAAVVTWLVDGRPGLRRLVAPMAQWRFGARWYAVAVLLMPCLFILAVLIQSAWTSTPVRDVWQARPWYFLLFSFLFLMMVTSGEELGWRGFALPRMQELWPHPVRNSVVLGTVWGLWHGALYLVPGPGLCPFPLFLVLTIALSILYTMLAAQTGGSLLPALLLHAGTDIAPRFLDLTHFTTGTWALAVTLVTMVAAWCAATPRLMNPPPAGARAAG